MPLIAAGGRIIVGEHIAGDVMAAGGWIVLSGKASGDVERTSRSISILDSAVIDGKLIYRSSQQAEIASEVRIRWCYSASYPFWYTFAVCAHAARRRRAEAQYVPGLCRAIE